MTSRIDPLRIAIVGMGSRGLSLLEQFIALHRHEGRALHIDLFDPQTPGSGLHLSEQPDYLMLNTMAGQLSAFSTAHPATQPPGLSFLAWCQAHDLRLDARGHLDSSGQGRPIGFGDFVPRRLLGRYLQDSYRWLLGHCPPGLQVQHVAQRVVSAQPHAAGWQLGTGQGEQRIYDALFISCGHAIGAPLPVDIGQRVAIEGLGLSAMDTLASLTEGRGGRFVADNSLAGWRYVPSGAEPRLYLYSRSGRPFHARPQHDGVQRQAWSRLYFTAAAIEALRRQATDGQLDFTGEVLPLIEDEMRAVFYQACVRLEAPAQLSDLQQSLRHAADTHERQALFTRLAAQWGPFDPAQWHATEPWSGAPESYAAWFRQWIEQDLIRSRSGTSRSPLTQALEVWRDYRDVLRLVADHDGLQAHSTQAFYAVYAGVSNRLVGGPQRERHEDLLALIDAGVVEVLAPAQASVLEVEQRISARVSHSGLRHNRNELLADLLRQGLIHAAHPYPADGVAIDAVGRALRADGQPHSHLWLLGPAVEGCTFYNHYVPTPDPQCLAPLQARRAVHDCLQSLALHLSTDLRNAS
ncbi:FAD/NAD(P)-binding protein [Pseudomonas sp. 3A(2025)]